MASPPKQFRFTFFFLLFVTTLVTGEWMWRTEKNVATGNILQTFQELSVTSCTLKCKRDRMCRAFGTEREMRVGELGECYLLSDDSEDAHQGSLVTSMFVTKMINLPSNNDLKTQEEAKWILQESNLCFGIKDDDHGVFKASQTGKICGIKLKYVSGKVWCHLDFSSYWGCPWTNGHVSHENKLMIVITDNNDNIIYPKIKLVRENSWGYLLDGYDENSKIVDLDFGGHYAVKKGEELRVWHSEDLYNGYEVNNKGRTCTRVYAKFDC